MRTNIEGDDMVLSVLLTRQVSIVPCLGRLIVVVSYTLFELAMIKSITASWIALMHDGYYLLWSFSQTQGHQETRAVYW